MSFAGPICLSNAHILHCMDGSNWDIMICWLLKKRVKQGFFFWTTFITTGNFWYCFFVPVFLCSFQPVMASSVVHLVWVFILIVMTSVMTHLASWFFCESSSWILTLLEVYFFMAFWGCFSSPSFFLFFDACSFTGTSLCTDIFCYLLLLHSPCCPQVIPISCCESFLGK